MATISDQAVCIRRWDFSETSQTVSLLTREHGIIRGLAKGAKREKSAFSGGFDLLQRGHVAAIVKPGRDLATLTEWQLTSVCWAVRQNLAANRAGLYVADLIHHMLTDADPHPGLYDALAAMLGALDGPATDLEPALLVFQWSLLRECGYQPELDRDAQSGGALPGDAATLAFSASAGGVVADTGAGDRWRVRRATVQALRAVAAGGSLDAADRAAVERANRLLAVYLREIMGRDLATMSWLVDPSGPAW